MKQTKVDRRVKYTKAMLRQALLNLMQDKPVSKITVTDVCREADINRNTFYTHYSSVMELLRSIEDDVFQQLEQTLSTQPAASSLERMCRMIQQDYGLYRVLFSDNNDNHFLQSVMQAVYTKTSRRWQHSMRGVSDEQLQLLYEYAIHGGVAVIKRWVQGDMLMGAKEVSRLIIEVSNNGLGTYERAAQSVKLR